MKKLEVNVGSKRVVVDLDTLTIRRIKQLVVAIDDIKEKHLPQVKYPVLDGETADQWYSRITAEILEGLKKLDGESDTDYSMRLAAADLEDHTIMIGMDLLQEIVKMFNLKVELTEDDIENASWPLVRNFLHDLLSEADLGAATSMFPLPITSKDRA